MHSTMQEAPLLIRDILRHGQQVHGDSAVTTVEEGGSRRATFNEVAIRAEKLAAALTRLGIEPGDRVGTFCWNNQGHLEAYLAIPAMGAVLHTLNIRLPAEQLAYVVNHAEDRCIIVDASLIPLLAAIKDDLKTVETIIVVGEADTSSLGETLSYERLLGAEEAGFDWPDLDERSAAAMCYTSGTTGNPKGVVYSHRSIWLHTMAEQSASSVGMMETDRILIIVPMFHAMAWGTPYGAWLAGTDMIMPQMYLMGQSLADVINEHHPTLACGVPTIWNGLLALDTPIDFSTVRAITAGGAAVPESLIEAFEKRFGATIIQGWGMTETSPLAAFGLPRRAATTAMTPCTTRSRPAAWWAGSRCASSPKVGSCSPTTGSRSASSRSAARGSRARTTRTRTRRSSTTAGCAPATSAPSTPRAT